MLVYRIARENYIHDLSGTGAKLYGGRWNRPGFPVLYTSQARSLALLELIVHFSSLKALHQNYSFAVLELPDKYLVTLPEASLPKDMFRYNHPVLWELTEHYFKEQDVLILRVPSVLVSGEYNYLLNPAHESFKRVRAISIEPAILDERYKNLLGKM